MKIKCDFCNTEYNVDKIPATPVRCAICGHNWIVKTPARRNSFLMFVAALCALLAAVVFTITAITQYNASQLRKRPLLATITASEIVYDDSGTPHFKVYGTVRNQSADIYGVPDLEIVSYDASGNEVNRQRFQPSGTLLDAGGLVNFTHTLNASSNGVKRLSAELVGVKK